jgi:Flp pilus assembly pilin Flp
LALVASQDGTHIAKRVVSKNLSCSEKEDGCSYLGRAIHHPQDSIRGNLDLDKEQKDMKSIKKFFNDESGMETLEYAVIAGLIAIAAAVIYASGGTWATTILGRLENAAKQS